VADDNVVTFTGSNPDPILIIQPDGTKLRGGDMVPIDGLPREALLKIIDELCHMIAHRGTMS
jgi:hypothetical protein